MVVFVDPTQPIDRRIIEYPIDAAAPERKSDLQDIWKKYDPSFFCVADEKGITLKAQKSSISFSPKTMSVFWLLGFAAWKIFVCHSPHLFLSVISGREIDDDMLQSDDGLYEAKGAFTEILSASEDLISAESLDDVTWPDDVPRPLSDKTNFSVEQQATFDLIMIATAYAMLHEIKHVMFNQDGNRPSDADEEIACDTFARDFILDGYLEYADESGEPADKILMKRAMGIALGAFIVYEMTPDHGLRGNSDYPPIADRFDALIGKIQASADNDFWMLAGTLLIATLHRWDRNVAIPSDTPDKMCRSLIDEIRNRVL